MINFALFLYSVVWNYLCVCACVWACVRVRDRVYVCMCVGKCVPMGVIESVAHHVARWLTCCCAFGREERCSVSWCLFCLFVSGCMGKKLYRSLAGEIFWNIEDRNAKLDNRSPSNSANTLDQTHVLMFLSLRWVLRGFLFFFFIMAVS